MDTAGLAVKMSCEARAVDWRSEGLSQAEITNKLFASRDRCERMQKDKVCKSNARLRPELKQMFAGCKCNYDLNQQTLYLFQPDSETPLMQKDWRGNTMLPQQVAQGIRRQLEAPAGRARRPGLVQRRPR